MLSRKYVVEGRVQGVGFRWFAQHAARQHGILGWVMNRPDGRVEIQASGDEGTLREFEEEIHKGPLGARVDRVNVTQVATVSNESGFSIR